MPTHYRRTTRHSGIKPSEISLDAMKQMEPMKPLESMRPLATGAAWWPHGLGEPASSGAQDGMRYAFFPKARRLVVDENGRTTTYDSEDHDISGVSQQSNRASTLAFTSQKGTVDLATLKTVA